MSKKQYKTVYVVVRVDHFPGVERLQSELADDGNGIFAGDYSVTVKEVVTTLEEAQREAKRLDDLRGDEGCRYYWESTHYFPNGDSHGPQSS